MQYIHPDHIHEGTPWPQTVWPTSYDLPVVSWRWEDLYVEFPPPDLTQPTAVREDKIDVPFNYALEPNYPNPFNPSTTIKYSMAEGARVNIKVYNISGQEVASLVNTDQKAGRYTVQWTGKDVSTGVYFYTLTAGDFSQTKKAVFVK